MGRIILLLAVMAAGCMEPGDRATLTVELLGPANPRPRCLAGDPGLGAQHPRGEPVAGASVALSPGGFAATSDTSGRVVFANLPWGRYTLQVAAPGHLQPPARAVEVAEGSVQTLAVNLTPCISAGANRPRVGFGASVSLAATSRCGSAWDAAAITWSQVEGPDVRASVASWTGSTFTFSTLPLEKVRTLPPTARKLSFSPDEAGQYVFRVTARRADGLSSGAMVLVTSTDVTGALTSVPPGLRYYVAGPPGGPYKWVVDRWPVGWIRTLEGETTRTPSIVPLPPEDMTVQADITIREQNSDTSFNFVVGPWNLVNRDCGRSDCHPGLQKSWERTRHGDTWARLLDGRLTSSRGTAAESCAACHALGYEPSAANGGYDDVARRLKTSFPDKPARGISSSLPADLKAVSNVYCLACHGPARVDPPVAEQPGRFAAGVCAACHDRKPEQDRVAQWKQSKMSRTVTGDLNGPEAREACKRCHTAQGFYYEHFALARPPSGQVVVMTCCENLEPITCQTCHSPMYAHNAAQVFRSGSLKTRGGLLLDGLGSGALCGTCHTTDHNPAAAEVQEQRLAPHSPQLDLAYGKAGLDLAADGFPTLSGVACAAAVGESCVTCHMDSGPASGSPDHRQVGGHTFRMTSAGGTPNLKPCQACHAGASSFDPLAAGDFDGDGQVEGVRLEVDGLMAHLKTRLGAAIMARGYKGCDTAGSPGRWLKAGALQKIVVVDEQGYDLGDCDRNGRIEREEQPRTFPAADLALHRAGYNYLVVQTDGSRGLHNLPFTVRLLQRTIAALSQGKDLPAWELHK